MRYRLLIVLALLSLPTVAAASPEDLYDYGNSIGSAGWDMSYGHDDELDRDLLEAQRRRQAEERVRQERMKKEKDKQSDFFGQRVDIYDADISRTDEEESELKGRTPENSPTDN